MENIVIDFGNIISELENKQLILGFIRNTMFIEDVNGNLFTIETYSHGSYIDELIKRGACVKFNHIKNDYINHWDKDVMCVSKVKDFIEKHSKFWN